MAKTTLLHNDERDAGIEYPLWQFLNILSGVNDELERARLIATAVPSLIPCWISGVAIVDTVGERWQPVFQKDGRLLAKADTNRLLVELEPSFDAAFSQAPVLVCDTSDAKLWPFMVELGVCHLAAAPLMTVNTRLGVLFVGRHTLEPFSRREEQILATIAEHSVTKPSLGSAKAGRFELLGNWPDGAPEARRKALNDGDMTTVTKRIALHFVQGNEHPIVEALFASSNDLTAGSVDLIPGARSDDRSHPSDKVIFTTKGTLHVYLPETFDWFELNEWDLLYVPRNTPHQYWNYSGKHVSFMFLVVPAYA